LNLLYIAIGKESQKVLKSLDKYKKSINVAPFNKAVAPGKNLKKNKRTPMFIPDSRVGSIQAGPVMHTEVAFTNDARHYKLWLVYFLPHFSLRFIIKSC
jgi:hypothetical protein